MSKVFLTAKNHRRSVDEQVVAPSRQKILRQPEILNVNYPGWTYTLTYDPAGDQLKGIYYQAAERQRFPVAFVRVK